MRYIPKIAVAVILFDVAAAIGADVEPTYSGPQAGEKITGFQMRLVFDDDAGKVIDPVAEAMGRPILLVFVHQANRPTLGLVRALMQYASRRANDGLESAVIWLLDDATAGEEFLNRARHALPKDARIGISIDGAEGPGAYGLNRKVALTILIAKTDRIAANFALVQPSVQADAPRIFAALVKLIGGTPPTLEELGVTAPRADAVRKTTEQEPPADPKLRDLFRPFLKKDATKEDVDTAAAAIEAYAKDKPDVRRQIGRIARTIADSGKIKEYGTEQAQNHLLRWAMAVKPAPKTTDSKTEKSDKKP